MALHHPSRIEKPWRVKSRARWMRRGYTWGDRATATSLFASMVMSMAVYS
jgi:hypothetical protein